MANPSSGHQSNDRSLENRQDGGSGAATYAEDSATE
jgi:hypothetical protein